MMKGVIQVNVTMAVIPALKQMETVYLLTAGGPNNATQFTANYLYRQAFKAWAATLIAMKGYALTGDRMKEIQAVNTARKDAIAGACL